MNFFKREAPVTIPKSPELKVDLKTGLWDGKKRGGSRPRSRVGVDGVDGNVEIWPTEPNFEEHL